MEKVSASDLSVMRHSCAHLAAAAVQALWPNVKFGIGPAIEDGFYYDFDLAYKFTPEDLPKIETKMHELANEGYILEQFDKPIDAALKEAKEAKQSYKQELIKLIASNGNSKANNVSFYRLGKFVDLCRGPHIHSTKEIGPFKLLSVAGAYWQGSEKNPMLQRIYGICFPSKEELDQYLWQQEEAKKRDHKKLGPSLELFMFHETAPGMPYWLPKGVALYNELISFWREEHSKRGYQEIVSPLLNKKELYVTSGHYEHYWQDMFSAEPEKGEIYGIKAMNCPNAMNVFAFKTRSYQDLPLRLSDTDTLHRYELSGTLNGLLRVREFRQDDAHCFVSEEQIRSEYEEIFELVELFYSIFNMQYSFRFSTRPNNSMGDIGTWDKAESDLKEILEKSEKEFFIGEGEGAFYGPKIDIMVKDALGRQWQMGTIQLDFQMPKRFRLTYTDSYGKQKTPIAIHRVIYGSLERFIGILIEHFNGAFPIWLAPVQAILIPIADRHIEKAKAAAKKLSEHKFRIEVNDRSETMQAKIRDAQLQKIPYMLIIGDKEQESGSVSVRLRNGENLGAQPFAKFLERICKDRDIKRLT